MELYKNIRTRREALGMSQDELAKKLGYKSRSSINKIEMGKNDLPQSKIEEFARALDTTPGCLMGWDKNEKPAVTSDDELSDEEWELIKRYRGASEETKRIIDKIV